MNKKVIRIILIIVIVILILMAVWFFLPAKVSLNIDKKMITNILTKKYSSYEIKDLELEYVDWSSTLKTADQDHKATRAKAVVQNEENQFTIYFEKGLVFWKITSALPDHGSIVPNELYYIETEIQHVGKAVDIENNIKDYWIIPLDDGSAYTKDGGSDWYYTFKECKNIYKTIDGKVYVYNKDTSAWDVSTINYSDLEHFSNYKNVNYDYVTKILEHYENNEN